MKLVALVVLSFIALACADSAGPDPINAPNWGQNNRRIRRPTNTGDFYNGNNNWSPYGSPAQGPGNSVFGGPPGGDYSDLGNFGAPNGPGSLGDPNGPKKGPGAPNGPGRLGNPLGGPKGPNGSGGVGDPNDPLGPKQGPGGPNGPLGPKQGPGGPNGPLSPKQGPGGPNGLLGPKDGPKSPSGLGGPLGGLGNGGRGSSAAVSSSAASTGGPDGSSSAASSSAAASSDGGDSSASSSAAAQSGSSGSSKKPSGPPVDFGKFLVDYQPQVKQMLSAFLGNSFVDDLDFGSVCGSVQNGDWSGLLQTLQKITASFQSPPQVNKEQLASSLSVIIKQAGAAIADIIANAASGGFRPGPKLTNLIDNIIADFLDFYFPDGDLTYMTSGALINDLWEPLKPDEKLSWTDIPGLSFVINFLPELPSIILSNIDFPDVEVTTKSSSGSFTGTKSKGNLLKPGPKSPWSSPKKPEPDATKSDSSSKKLTLSTKSQKTSWDYKSSNGSKPKPTPGFVDFFSSSKQPKIFSTTPEPIKPSTEKLTTTESPVITTKKPVSDKPKNQAWSFQRSEDNYSQPSPLNSKMIWKYTSTASASDKTKPGSPTDKASTKTPVKEPDFNPKDDAPTEANTTPNTETTTTVITSTATPKYQTSWNKVTRRVTNNSTPTVFGSTTNRHSFQSGFQYPGHQFAVVSPENGNKFVIPAGLPIPPGNDVLPNSFKYNGHDEEVPIYGSGVKVVHPGYGGFKSAHKFSGFYNPIFGFDNRLPTYVTASSSASATASSGTDQSGYSGSNKPGSGNPNKQPTKYGGPGEDDTKKTNDKPDFKSLTSSQPTDEKPEDDGGDEGTKQPDNKASSTSVYGIPQNNEPGSVSDGKQPGFGENKAPSGDGNQAWNYNLISNQPNFQISYGSPADQSGYANKQLVYASAGNNQPSSSSDGSKQADNAGNSSPGYGSSKSIQLESGNKGPSYAHEVSQPLNNVLYNSQLTYGNAGNKQQSSVNFASNQPGFGKTGYVWKLTKVSQPVDSSASSSATSTSSSGSNSGYLYGQPGEVSVSSAATAESSASSNAGGGSFGNGPTNQPGYFTGDASASSSSSATVQSGVTVPIAAPSFVYGQPNNYKLKYYLTQPTTYYLPSNDFVNTAASAPSASSANLNVIPHTSIIEKPEFAVNNGGFRFLAPTFKPWTFDAGSIPAPIAGFGTNGLNGGFVNAPTPIYSVKPFQVYSNFNDGTVIPGSGIQKTAFTLPASSQEFNGKPLVIKEYTFPNNKAGFVDIEKGKINFGNLENGQSVALGNNLKLSAGDTFRAGKSQVGGENFGNENNNLNSIGSPLNSQSFNLNGIHNFKLPIYGINGKVNPESTKVFKIPKPT